MIRGCRWNVVYGRVYCIFEIKARYYKRRRAHRRGGQYAPEPIYQDEICLLIKEFTKVSSTHVQPRLSYAPSHARSLANSGCVKLLEETHAKSVWSVVPSSYILGRATLVPVSVQKTSKLQWSPESDNKARLHWALPWPQMMGKDRGALILKDDSGFPAAMADYYADTQARR